MHTIEVRPVRGRRERELFLAYPWRIYRGDPLWVPPLLPDRRKVIDPQQGTFFRRGGTAEFFIAWRGDDPVGTICCGEDPEVNGTRRWRDCVIGFFECVNDGEVAAALFDHAAGWARGRGLDTLYGPINLDYEDAYGVLVEGRDRPPALLCGHTPAYYQGFFQGCGFVPGRDDNLAFALDLDLSSAPLQHLHRVADRVRSRGHYRVRGADLKHWRDETEKVYSIINHAMEHLPDFTPWPRESLFDLMESLLPVADPDLVLFAEDLDGKVVGWFPAVPNMNEALIHANGLRHPWDYVPLLWYMKRPRASMSVKSVIVPPEYWDTGVAILLADELVHRAVAKGYRWADLSLTSADNPRTPQLAGHLGAHIYKRYRVYRKWLTAMPQGASH